MKAARPTVFWSARRRYWGAGAFCNAGISRKRARADSRAEDHCRRAATFAQEDQPLERSRRRASFHYARRRHRTAASRGEGDEGHPQCARRSYGRDGSGFG